jgi:hypothetical protein
VVSKIAVAAPGLSYVTLRKITATHVRSIPRAMWFISTYCVGSGPAYRMRSTTAWGRQRVAHRRGMGVRGRVPLAEPDEGWI